MSSATVAASPWAWEARPDVWALIASIAGAYWWSVRHLRPRLSPPPPAPNRGEIARFTSGLVLLWAAVDWPLDRLGDEFLFSAHMVQFLVITMISAPLMVSALPGWLLVEVTHPIRRIIPALTKAPVALGVFQLVLVGTHLPWVVDLYATNSVVHFGLHTLWVLAAGLFWMPIFGRRPFVRPLQPPLKIGYLIAATVLPTIPASFLTWTETAFYAPYRDAQQRVWGISPVLDLQLAGLVMKLGGGIILWTVIIGVFARWATDERRPPASMRLERVDA